MQKAIIYSRVSSQRQVDEGHGLEGQEKRCSQYAKDSNLNVIKIFRDEGISGGVVSRPGMQSLLNYLESNQREKFAVIIDDIKRLARDVQGHFELKTAIYSRGAYLVSPTHKFEDTAEGKFVETILASAGELERNQNRRQVMSRMKARFELGYWPLCYPPGLINIRHELHGKILTPHEPKASIFKEVIERYRDGLHNTQEQVKEFINNKYQELGLRPFISLHGASNVLTNPLYAGWIEYKPWGIPLKKAKHEGFITKETYDKVQEKVNSKSRFKLRNDYHVDFPMRGYVVCSECKKPLTASWCTGRHGKKYAHYFCKHSECSMCWKTIKKTVLETNFEHFMTSLSPNKDVMKLVRLILLDIWEDRVKIEQESKKITDLKIGEQRLKMNTLIDRVTKTTNEELIRAYEVEITKLQKQESDLLQESSKAAYTQENFGTALDKVLSFMMEPVLMWRSQKYEDKRLLLDMFFEEKLTSDRYGNLGTPSLAPLPKLLAMREASENTLVDIATETWNQIYGYIIKFEQIIPRFGSPLSHVGF